MHIWEVCGGINATQSSTLAAWDLRKDSNGSGGKEHSKPLANTDAFLQYSSTLLKENNLARSTCEWLLEELWNDR